MPSVYDLPQSEQDDLMSVDINPISPLKMKYINELRSLVKDLLDSYEYSPEIISDIEILRFVRGHMFNMEEAHEAYRKMLVWRKENKIEEYTKKVEEVGYDVHKVPYADIYEPIFNTNYNHRMDREGHIIDIRMLGQIDVKALIARPLKEWIDYTIYTLEWRIHLLNNTSRETGVLQRLCCIQDLKGVGMHMISPTLITYLKEMANVTSHNYPEIMHRSFIVSVPSFFSSLWSLAKPVMHPRTVKKIVICKGDYQPALYNDISIRNIPVCLGGICKCDGGCLTCMENEKEFNIAVSTNLTIPLEVKQGEKISWNWKLASGDINFVVRFKNANKTETEVFKGDRIKTHSFTYQAPEDGEISFFYDNSFSWVSGKTVIGMITIDE